MATRKDIREAFYAELETAADGLVPPADITQEYPESEENLPAIVHDDAYRPIPMHNNSAAAGVVRDESGAVIEYEYSKPMQAQFTVLVLSADEMEKENIYESLSSHFEEFTLPISDPSEIHTDLYRVEVLDVNSQDDEDREPVARGDSMTIHLDFERVYTRDVDSIDEVQHEVDSGTTDTGDGITDFTQTTN